MKKIFVTLFLVISLPISACAGERMKDSATPAQVFFGEAVRAVGISASGQSRFAAIRAAEVDAHRRLLGTIKGIHIWSDLTVEAKMTKNDIVKTHIEGTLKGVTRCENQKDYYNTEQGYAEVCVQVSLRGRGGVYEAVYPVIHDMIPRGRRLNVADDNPSATSKKTYDGLIVDIRQFRDFQPALANRILDSKEQIVYDLSMIPQIISIEQGLARFTNTDAKAEAILEKLGSKNPFIVKAKGLKAKTDIVIEDKDAETVFINNQKSNMLASARVVFLLSY